MKYTRLPSFLADWRALSRNERTLIKRWLAEEFLPAVEAYEADPTGFIWPASIRFERLRNSGGICAVTWSFSGPDGRATFQIETINHEPHLIWRRIGHHAIYKRP